jgi:hypothetical protein
MVSYWAFRLKMRSVLWKKEYQVRCVLFSRYRLDALSLDQTNYFYKYIIYFSVPKSFA